jgi:hypothetical protein
MKKYIAFIRYFECRHGRTYAEAASALELSARTIGRYFERIEEICPGLSIERSYGEGRELRLRLRPRSPLCSSASSQDILTLHALHSAARLAQRDGDEHLADRLTVHVECLLSRLPRATRLLVETQVNNLLEAEACAPPPALRGCQPQDLPMRGAILDRLRLAAATRSSVRLVMAGNSIVAGIKVIQYTDQGMIVSLRTNGEELSVSLSEIKDVLGIDDLLLGLVAA